MDLVNWRHNMKKFLSILTVTLFFISGSVSANSIVVAAPVSRSETAKTDIPYVEIRTQVPHDREYWAKITPWGTGPGEVPSSVITDIVLVVGGKVAPTFSSMFTDLSNPKIQSLKVFSEKGGDVITIKFYGGDTGEEYGNEYVAIKTKSGPYFIKMTVSNTESVEQYGVVSYYENFNTGM